MSVDHHFHAGLEPDADVDPETAHPADLLGCSVHIDWGSQADVGEIVEVIDHNVHGRKLRVVIETESGSRGATVRPEKQDLTLLGGDSE